MYKRSPNFMKIGAYRFGRRYKQCAFTLVELVAGIVVSAIALTFLSALFFSNPNRSVEPLLQIRAAEFGQALMDEILAKRFDETTPVGGIPPCSGCTTDTGLGSDGAELRIDYDDVDDYHEYCLDDGSGDPGWPITDALGANPVHFSRYRMRVCVNYDGDYNGVADTNTNAKLITVDIYPPSSGGFGSPITISAYRGNF